MKPSGLTMKPSGETVITSGIGLKSLISITNTSALITQITSIINTF
jgi:hypothetical protein